MDAKIFSVQNAGDREAVEKIHKSFEDGLVSALLAQHLLSEGVLGGHLPGFVVSPEQNDIFGGRDLQRHDDENDLERVRPPIDVVPQEKILQRPVPRYDRQQAHQIIELPMDIPDDRDRVIKKDQVAFPN